jgi:hypothetical protein
LYVYFFRKAFDLLNEGGRLAFITPNKFLRARYGSGLREFLSQKSSLEVLVDFGDLPVFDATTYPFITIAHKAHNANSDESNLTMLPEQTLKEHIGDARADGVREVREGLSSFHEFAPSLLKTFKQNYLTSGEWVLDTPEALALIEKLKANGTPLGEFSGEGSYRGIVTGLNEAFVIDRSKRDALIEADPKSAEVIKPFLRGRDVKRWKIDFAEFYLILAGRGFNLSQYPAIADHLESHKAGLEKRATVPRSHPWYELQQPQENYWQMLESPKIIYPQFATSPSFALDKHGFYTNNKIYFIPALYDWMTSILNSRLIAFVFSASATAVQGGYFEHLAIYIDQLPIVEPTPAQQAELETYTDDSRFDELNALVYEIYGLTPEEIAIVEDHTKDML